MSSTAPGRVVVFLGPTLPTSEAQALLPDAEVRPPARRGDIYRLLADEPAALVLIDGVFHAEPSVWPRELLAAVDDGVPVYGASSMGALRAAECGAFGVIGHGTVFEWYASGRIDGDDEVALRHGDAESGWRALSEPMVNVRATLDAAVAAGLAAASEAEALAAAVKRLHYPERSLRGLGTLGASEALAAWAREHRVDVKRADAVSLLTRVATERPGRDPGAARAPEAHDESWRVELGAGPLLAELRRRPRQRAALRALALRRWYAVDLARQLGLVCPPPALAAARAAHPRAAELSGSDYERALAAAALADWVLATRGEQALLAEWAARAGLPGFAEAPELRARLLDEGPSVAGRKWPEETQVVRAAQLAGGVAALAAEPAR